MTNTHRKFLTNARVILLMGLCVFTMTDDIVTRLREIVADPKPIFTQDVLVNAADEIERLRNIIIGIALNKQVWKGFNFD